jgi:hypothetical protein
MGNKAVCSNCNRRIWRNGPGGSWYHNHNASASCRPGGGGWKRATPREVR